MDAPETTKLVFQRLMELEPQYATRILGYILIQDHGKQDVIRLAFAPDKMIKSVIEKAKQALKISPITITSDPNLSRKDKQLAVSKLTTNFTPFTPSSSRLSTLPQVNNYQIENYIPTYQPITNHIENVSFSYFGLPINGVIFHNHPLFMPLEGQIDHGSHSVDVPELERDLKPNKSQVVLREMKFCERFNLGFCRFGGECRFLHCTSLTDDFIMIVNPINEFDVVKEYHLLSHGSVKKLEKEVIEILKSKGVEPVPISNLPDLYRERYGRELEITGYYTEHYMQGKVISCLNQLLIHLTNKMRLIQREEEICVILAKNIQMYLKFNNEWDQDLTRSPACQVFVTFRPESTFTKQDFYNYFNNYGPVKSVRFPDQLQRMFGFVTFFYPVSVTVVLAKGNPHFIRGMRLLVKPYQADNRKSEQKENLQEAVRTLADDESNNLSRFPEKHPVIEEHNQSVASCSSSHNSSNKAVTSFSSPRGVCIGGSSKGKGVVIHDYEEERS